MPPLKSSLIKPSKSMLFFHIWNANFSVTPINSQMYMTKPKQVQKKLSENTGKTFSVIMPSFTCRGWAYLRKLLYKSLNPHNSMGRARLASKGPTDKTRVLLCKRLLGQSRDVYMVVYFHLHWWWWAAVDCAVLYWAVLDFTGLY